MEPTVKELCAKVIMVPRNLNDMVQPLTGDNFPCVKLSNVLNIRMLQHQREQFMIKFG